MHNNDKIKRNRRWRHDIGVDHSDDKTEVEEGDKKGVVCDDNEAKISCWVQWVCQMGRTIIDLIPNGMFRSNFFRGTNERLVICAQSVKRQAFICLFVLSDAKNHSRVRPSSILFGWFRLEDGRQLSFAALCELPMNQLTQTNRF
uniref:Uncharacterized protein n=1 Tax=Setaria digitata TaxID=48799 RepID=A0A915PKX5_9BILA